MAKLFFTVTNDLNYDQRMIRICRSLSDAGYDVTLVGRKRKSSAPLNSNHFQQKRLYCFFEKGLFFYAEFNIRLFFFLLFRKMDLICAIDLDTILPCLLVSRIKNTKRVYDAHELFCEMKEVSERPLIYKFWKWVEKISVPNFEKAYTVNSAIAHEFKKMYGAEFGIIRSIALYHPFESSQKRDKIILYQGAVNEGRCFETLIPAMKNVEARLIVCGDGNFMGQARVLVKKFNLENKIEFKGMVSPDLLQQYTRKAKVGITLFEKASLNNYYSLANRFFDYIHAGTPQLCMNYPTYHELNKQYDIGVLTDIPDEESISKHLNDLLNDETKWNTLHLNCIKASKELCWQVEEKKLLEFYKTILG